MSTIKSLNLEIAKEFLDLVKEEDSPENSNQLKLKLSAMFSWGGTEQGHGHWVTVHSALDRSTDQQKSLVNEAVTVIQESYDALSSVQSNETVGEVTVNPENTPDKSNTETKMSFKKSNKRR